MKKQNEILRINFILLMLAAMFFSSGLYNKYAYKEVISASFSMNLMYTSMLVIGIFGTFFMSRSNICRNVATALSLGLMPAIICMYIAYVREFSFEIISTFMLYLLTVIRSYLAIKRTPTIPPVARTVLIVRYGVVMFAIMGIMAFVFIKT